MHEQSLTKYLPQPRTGSMKKTKDKKKKRMRSSKTLSKIRNSLQGESDMRNESLTESDSRLIRKESRELNRFSRAKWAAF